jgi:hypothetical protein
MQPGKKLSISLEGKDGERKVTNTTEACNREEWEMWLKVLYSDTVLYPCIVLPLPRAFRTPRNFLAVDTCHAGLRLLFESATFFTRQQAPCVSCSFTFLMFNTKLGME